MVTRWEQCYADSWQDVITPESFSHPAKFSKQLIFRIIQHLVRSKYLQKGDTILDPFGGVALGALPSLTYGLGWIGIELEERFHTLGNANLAKWERDYGFTGGVLLHGDSRQLRAVLAGAAAQGVVGSPPYAEAITNARSGIDMTKGTDPRDPHSLHARRTEELAEGYGTTPGQLGNASGDTFWSAAAQILTELWYLLPPDAPCVWVVKPYVKNKKIVPFDKQWQSLCESHGFVTKEIIHAMLVEEHGTQETLFGNTERVFTKRASFFRRLAEKKGSPSIDSEVVLIMRRSA